MEREFVCSLHSSSACDFRGGYGDNKCTLSRGSEFATCQYRIEAVVLAAAKPVERRSSLTSPWVIVESPENVVQQTNGGSEASTQIAADTVDDQPF